MSINAYAITSKLTLDLKDWSGRKDQAKADAKELATKLDQATASAAAVGPAMAAASKQLSGSLQASASAAKTTGASVNQLSEQEQRAAVEAELLARATGKLDAAFDKAAKAADRAEASLGRLGKTSRAGSREMDTAADAGKKLLVAGLVAAAVEKLGQAVGKSSVEFRTGQKSFSEASGEMLRQIPVLGDMTRGFDGLREAVTGEKAAMEIARQELDETTQSLKGMAAARRALADLVKQNVEADKPADVDEDVYARVEAAKAKIAEERDKERERLRKEREAASRPGNVNQPRLESIRRQEEANERNSADLMQRANEELQRSLARRQSQRAAERTVERGKESDAAVAAEQQRATDFQRAGRELQERIARSRKAAEKEAADRAKQDARQRLRNEALDLQDQLGDLQGRGIRRGPEVDGIRERQREIRREQINITAPPLDEQRLGQALADELQPRIEARVDQVQSAARLQLHRNNVRRGL